MSQASMKQYTHQLRNGIAMLWGRVAFYVHCRLPLADWKVYILALVFRQRNSNIIKEEHPFCESPD